MHSPEQYMLAGTADMKQFANTVASNSYTEALQQYNTLIKTNPSLKTQVQILSADELNLN